MPCRARLTVPVYRRRFKYAERRVGATEQSHARHDQRAHEQDASSGGKDVHHTTPLSRWVGKDWSGLLRPADVGPARFFRLVRRLVRLDHEASLGEPTAPHGRKHQFTRKSASSGRYEAVATAREVGELAPEEIACGRASLLRPACERPSAFGVLRHSETQAYVGTAFTHSPFGLLRRRRRHVARRYKMARDRSPRRDWAWSGSGWERGLRIRRGAAGVFGSGGASWRGR